MDGTEYITLKEAGEISGYSPDYIGQLIRRGKLEGKQVYANVAWVTTKNALEGYLRDKGKSARELKDTASGEDFSHETDTDTGASDAVSDPEMGRPGERERLSFERWERYFRMVSIAIIACSVLFLILLFHVFSTLLDDRLERRAFERVSSFVPVSPV
jgi:hypothetical protein